jgi:hypothetical protein
MFFNIELIVHDEFQARVMVDSEMQTEWLKHHARGGTKVLFSGVQRD